MSKPTVEHKLKVSEMIIELFKMGAEYEEESWSKRWCEILSLPSARIAREAQEYLRNYSDVDYQIDLDQDNIGTLSIGYLAPPTDTRGEPT